MRPTRWAARSPPPATGRDGARPSLSKSQWSRSGLVKPVLTWTTSDWKKHAHVERTASPYPRDRRQRRDPRGFQEDADRRGGGRCAAVEAGGGEGSAVRKNRGAGRPRDAVRDRF